MPLSDYVTSPTSWQNRQLLGALAARDDQHALADGVLSILTKPPLHSGHPNFGHLALLVFEAVLEVVCVSLPGYIVASQGMFDAESQKFLANLNVLLFTPCLIFTKLASQLTAEKLADLVIIPVIFVVQTLVSYACARIIAKGFRFNKRQTNFLIAMGVFGNSNSLPISLVISLSKTLKGLHWDKVPNDNDDEVAARGILYLLIFQQLGQLVRWSWGYNVLLAPPESYTEAEGGTKQSDRIERGRGEYQDDVSSDHEQHRLLGPSYDSGSDSTEDFDDDTTRVGDSPGASKDDGLKIPRTSCPQSVGSSRTSSQPPNSESPNGTPSNGHVIPHHSVKPTSLPEAGGKKYYDEDIAGLFGYVNRVRNVLRNWILRTRCSLASRSTATFHRLPEPVQRALSATVRSIGRFLAGVWEFMNPPLWAMLIAIIVASVPKLQHLFFDNGTFVRNSVTRAVEQSGGVAVPLILVVLGGNLARNTLPKEGTAEITDPKQEKRLLIASLVSRMVLPTIIMAPFLALVAKYVPVSIVDDKIFVIVCFLLTGAPTALQLAQICQVNNVYMNIMSSILFQSYVVWILPSTLILVLLALETVEWATY